MFLPQSYSGRSRFFNSVQFLCLSRIIRGGSVVVPSKYLDVISMALHMKFASILEFTTNKRLYEISSRSRSSTDPLSHKDTHFITGSNTFGKEHKLFLKEMCFKGEKHKGKKILCDALFIISYSYKALHARLIMFYNFRKVLIY